MMQERPQPGHIDAVSGQIIHEAQRKLVIVDGRGEVAVKDLEPIIGRHIERVLDVLDRNVATGHIIDTVPKLRRQKLLGGIDGVLGENPRCDLPLRAQQAARLQQRPFRVNQAAGRGRHGFFLQGHHLLRCIDDGLEFAQRRLQRSVTRGDIS